MCVNSDDLPGVRVQFLDYNKEGNWFSQFTNAQFSLWPGKTLQEVIMEMKTHQIEGSFGGLDCMPDGALEFVAKSLLYIHSGEPDIKAEKGNPPRSSYPEKRKRHLRNFCPFTVLNVGYGYHERFRHVDASAVVGHFRWQPYGPLNGKVKLIWIEEHIRTYRRQTDVLESSHLAGG